MAGRSRWVGSVASMLVALVVLSGCGDSSDRPSAESTSAVVFDLDDALSASDVDVDADVETFRQRLAALGIDGDVEADGTSITVTVPADDADLVRQVMAVQGRVEFRPVLEDLGVIPAPGADDGRIAALRAELAVPDGVSAADVVDDETARSQRPSAPTSPTMPTMPGPATTIDPTTSGGSAGASGGSAGGSGVTTAPASASTVAPDPTPPTTVGDVPLNRWGVDVYDERFAELYQLESLRGVEVTAPDDVTADSEVTLVDGDGFALRLGPTLLTGSALESADAQDGGDGGPAIALVFRAGADGIDLFNDAAALCNSGAAECPGAAGQAGRLAIVLDGEVLSAPTINNPSFERDQIAISGDFSAEEVRSIAAALDSGGLGGRWVARS